MPFWLLAGGTGACATNYDFQHRDMIGAEGRGYRLPAVLVVLPNRAHRVRIPAIINI
jgi:hypothetical protein